MRRRRNLARGLAAAAALFLSACTTAPSQPSAEPANVGLNKLAAVKYHDSGAYMADFARAALPASDWLRQRAPQVPRPALVLDIDDTALTNWPVIVANDFGRFATGPCLLPDGPCGWAAWDLLGRDAPLDPTLEVFRTARSLGVTVFFISGRPESQRAATERNVKAVGYEGYEHMYLTPDGMHYPTIVSFKAPTRQTIAAMGYTIIANMGDQFSDLEGGLSERTYKLPNPFYYIP